MIFRRVLKHVQEQNWTAVAIDFVIVVVGVVLGFQVTAWGNERAARAEEQELLRGLRAEFTEVGAHLQRQVEKHQRVEHAVATTLDALGRAEAAGAPRAAVADTTLITALIATTTQPGQGVLDGMLATGRLSLLQDQALRTALAEWAGVLADATEDEVTSRTFVETDLLPLLTRQMDVRSMLTYELYFDTLPPEVQGATSSVPVDRELIGAFAIRRYWLTHTIREFGGPQAEAQRILGLIDRGLERRD